MMKFTCEFCGDQYSSSNSLYHHRWEMHYFSCDECRMKFSSNDRLISHIERSHTSEESLLSKTDCKTFSPTNAHTQHLNMDTGPPLEFARVDIKEEPVIIKEEPIEEDDVLSQDPQQNSISESALESSTIDIKQENVIIKEELIVEDDPPVQEPRQDKQQINEKSVDFFMTKSSQAHVLPILSKEELPSEAENDGYHVKCSKDELKRRRAQKARQWRKIMKKNPVFRQKEIERVQNYRRRKKTGFQSQDLSSQTSDSSQESNLARSNCSLQSADEVCANTVSNSVAHPHKQSSLDGKPKQPFDTNQKLNSSPIRAKPRHQPRLYTYKRKAQVPLGLVDDNVKWTTFIDSVFDDYESLKLDFWTRSEGEAKLRIFYPTIGRKPMQQYYRYLKNHRNKIVADIQMRKLFPGIINECPIREDACELADDLASSIAKTMEYLDSPMSDFRRILEEETERVWSYMLTDLVPKTHLDFIQWYGLLNEAYIVKRIQQVNASSIPMIDEAKKDLVIDDSEDKVESAMDEIRLSVRFAGPSHDADAKPHREKEKSSELFEDRVPKSGSPIDAENMSQQQQHETIMHVDVPKEFSASNQCIDSASVGITGTCPQFDEVSGIFIPVRRSQKSVKSNLD